MPGIKKLVLCLTFALAAFLLAGCGGGGPCGGPGQPCCGWPSPSCRDAASSCQSGTCQSCGTPGGPCCANYTCPANLFCNSTPSTPFRCEACGHIGQPTCNNMLCVTGVASGGRCVAPGGGSGGTGGGDMICNGSTPYLIGVRSYITRCAVSNVEVRANNRADARTCAERIARSNGFIDVEAIDETRLNSYARTATNPTGQCSVYRPNAYSEEDADRCVQYFCLNCTVERRDACPMRR